MRLRCTLHGRTRVVIYGARAIDTKIRHLQMILEKNHDKVRVAGANILATKSSVHCIEMNDEELPFWNAN
jgi:hypothetical protein